MPFQTRPFGPFGRGLIDTANPSEAGLLANALRRAVGVRYTGARKLAAREGTRVAMTFFDDGGGPAQVTSVCALEPFADWALVVAHSTVTSKVYLYRVAPDLTAWYNAAGVLQANTNAQPVGALWTGIADPPDVSIAEGLGIAYIAHNAAANGTTLAWPTKTYTVPATIATLTSDLDGAAGAEDLYALGVVSFQQHLWMWGVGSGAVAANHFRPELLRYCQPIFTFPFLAGDSITVGDRVRSQREKVTGAQVAGEALYIGSPFALTRITGFGRSSWFKQPLDKSYGFPGPKCKTTRGDTLYYWSSQGPMRIRPQGGPESLLPRVQAAVAAAINPETVVAGYNDTTDLVVFAYDRGNGVRAFLAYDELRDAFLGADDDLGLAVRYLSSVAPVYGSAAGSTSPSPPSNSPAGAPTTPSTTFVGATVAIANWVVGDATAELQVEYRPQGVTDWIVALSGLAPGNTSMQLSGLASGVAYEWRVAHLKGGVLSAYLGPVAGTQFTTTTTLNPPSAPILNEQNPRGGYTDIGVSWSNSGESDVETNVELAGPSAGPPVGGYVLEASPAEPSSSAVLTVSISGTYWVRLKHTKPGCTDSAYSGPTSVAVTVTGDPQ